MDFTVVVSEPEQVLPVQDPLPVEVTETSIFVVRTAFRASTQFVRLLPTSTKLPSQKSAPVGWVHCVLHVASKSLLHCV